MQTKEVVMGLLSFIGQFPRALTRLIFGLCLFWSTFSSAAAPRELSQVQNRVELGDIFVGGYVHGAPEFFPVVAFYDREYQYNRTAMVLLRIPPHCNRSIRVENGELYCDPYGDVDQAFVFGRLSGESFVLGPGHEPTGKIYSVEFDSGRTRLDLKTDFYLDPRTGREMIRKVYTLQLY